ncbi:MAG: hypothetical protein ACKVY0_24020 [Prosthecobacter sp.]|uniref:hypothetical protein n=1 Tax=Prosthecobacter sp. TaxID=1965333 RepID=UPI0038FDC32C
MPLVTVKRACKKLRVQGAAGFFTAPVPRQGHRLTPALIAQAQGVLDVPAISERLGVLPNTLHKAIRAARLKKVCADVGSAALSDECISAPSTQGARSVADGAALMGVATTRTL